MSNRATITLVLFAIAIIVLSFLGGTALPVWEIILSIDPNTGHAAVSTFQRVDLIIRVVTGMITVVGILLAFLKDDVWRILNRADIQLSPVKPQWFDEVIPKPTSGSKKKAMAPVLNAERYESILRVRNPTQVAVKGCKVRLDSLKLKHKAGSTEDVSIRQYQAVAWGEHDSATIDIPPGGDAIIGLFAISLNKIEGGEEDANPICQFGQHEHPPFDGIAQATFVVLAENVSVKRFTLEVKWDGGTWEHRRTEMAQHLQITAKGDLTVTGGAS